MQQFVQQHSSRPPHSGARCSSGNAANSILSFAQDSNMEVIVMGTHGRRGFDRVVLGSTTDRVMRKAACPVLIASDPSHKALATGPDGRHRLSRIIYCTDFSHNSERAQGEYAISLAAEYGAEISLYCMSRNESPTSGGGVSSCRAQAATRQHNFRRGTQES